MGNQAFDVKRGTAFFFNPNDLVIVGLDTKEGKENPLYDERVKMPVQDSLVKNIMAYGIIQPVVIVKQGESAMVVDGRQRVRAARRANEIFAERGQEPIMVPAVLRRGEDGLLMGVSLSANENRQGDDPIVQAAKIQRFLDLGRNEEEAAVVFGVTVQTITNRLKLLECAPTVRNAVKDGRLSASAALELSGLPSEDQKSALTKMIEEGKTTAKAAKTAKASNGNGKPATLGKKTIRKVLVEAQQKDVLTSEFVRGAMWAIGDLDHEAVSGLKAILDAIE